jgi:adenylate cyclase
MTAADAERKLAAIMFTDMVGYSALSQRDEALALALLHEHQCLLRPIFARHAGHEIKVTGDGFLVQFASALQAVRCAIAIQKDIIERNSSEAPGRRFQVRIGLHLGDVEVRDGDVFGDGGTSCPKRPRARRTGSILPCDATTRTSFRPTSAP